MNESIKVHYEFETTNDAGIIRRYGFSHPYGAPAGEAFLALETIKSQIEMRVAEIQNAQLAAQGQAPVIENETPEVVNGN